jgi:hypothetical protein
MVTVPDANALDLAPGMTLEAWVKPTTVSDWRTVMLKERPGQLVYALYAAAGNSVWGERFSGLIDEVRVYERALSAAEIQADRDKPIL